MIFIEQKNLHLYKYVQFLTYAVLWTLLFCLPASSTASKVIITTGDTTINKITLALSKVIITTVDTTINKITLALSKVIITTVDTTINKITLALLLPFSSRQGGQVELTGSLHLWCLFWHQGSRGLVEDQGEETLHQAEAEEDEEGGLHIAGGDVGGSVESCILFSV